MLSQESPKLASDAKKFAQAIAQLNIYLKLAVIFSFAKGLQPVPEYSDRFYIVTEFSVSFLLFSLHSPLYFRTDVVSSFTFRCYRNIRQMIFFLVITKLSALKLFFFRFIFSHGITCKLTHLCLIVYAHFTSVIRKSPLITWRILLNIPPMDVRSRRNASKSPQCLRWLQNALNY